ncbi:VC2046/SO_2500 family protein [Photobacterium salinisoli]|uniref:VC2046/SO_2500 family protein n=1 Tax=Photobacterium salinisoli TaxID=1616783 RepID=UPI000EA253D0|nr:VC2046/SO_2500 family protein [Photobacterium salinisoli]
MQIHTIDKAQLISEVQLGNQLNRAVEQGRRSDFALMLAMLSPDYLETTPTEKPLPPATSEEQLRSYFELQDPAPLSTSEFCYPRGAEQSRAFHYGGLSATRLLSSLQPIAMTFPPQDTKGLPEELYHNLSGHERRRLPPTQPEPLKGSPQDLYLNLIRAKRSAEMYGAVAKVC